MIIKVKKRFLTYLFLTLLIIPIVYAAGNIVKSGSFGVILVIGNRNPNVTLNNVTIGNIDPSGGSDIQVLISFNVTDMDGVTTINASTAVVNLTLGYDGGQWRSNVSKRTTSEFGTCYNHTQSSVMIINCTVVMRYFDNASSWWYINVSVKDTSGGVGRNNTVRFTYNELSSLALPYSWINFSTVNPGAENMPPSPNIILNNTGNDDFDQINITGASLIGTSDSNVVIEITNFYVNITNATAGAGAQLQTYGVTLREEVQPSGQTMYNATLLHGHTDAKTGYNDDVISTKGNRTIFFWVDVPTGKTTQLYNNTWNVTVIDIP